MALGALQAWNHLQQNLGFEIDARVIAFGIGSGQIPVPGSGTITGDQVFSVLWPRGYQARAQHLVHYQPYAPDTMLDRLLVVAARDEKLEHIDVTRSDWQARYADVLESHGGVVVLTAPADQSTALSQALRAVPALPVDRDVLRVYGEVRDVLRVGAEVRATIHIQEGLQ